MALMRVCRKCGAEKPLVAFTPSSECVHGATWTCKECTKAMAHLRWTENAGKYKERQKEYQTRPEVRERKRELGRKYYLEHRDVCLVRTKEKAQRLRREVVGAYGGKCACCGEARMEFLAIDHINGGGHRHRKAIGSFYNWIRREGYPAGFRVLCHNCNMAFGLYGYCPHVGIEVAPTALAETA